MLDLRPTMLVIGILLTTLGVAMLLPALIDLQDNHAEWVVFTASSAFTLFVGMCLTTVSWVAMAGTAAVTRRHWYYRHGHCRFAYVANWRHAPGSTGAVNSVGNVHPGLLAGVI